MTDPYVCWYGRLMRPRLTGVFVDGGHVTPYIPYMDPMGIVKPLGLGNRTLSWGPHRVGHSHDFPIRRLELRGPGLPVKT